MSPYRNCHCMFFCNSGDPCLLSNLVPSRAVPPMTDIPQPVSLDHQRPSSSSSSRDHGLRIDVHVQPQTQAQDPIRDEVSPLTPHPSDQPPTCHDEQPVSPIEPPGRAPSYSTLPNRPFQSQIPRKVVKQNGPDTKEQTKWDEYSGEPTTDERGKPASVYPGLPPLELQYPQLKERTKQILAGLRERDASKNLAWGRAPPPVSDDLLDRPIQREPWRGASGRAAIVEPVRNMPSARQGPLSNPVKTEHSTDETNPSIEHVSPSLPSPNVPQLRSATSEEEIRPIPPLRVGKRIRTPELVTNTTDLSPQMHSQPASPEALPPYRENSPEVFYHRGDSPQHDEEPTTPDTPVAVEIPRIAEESKGISSYQPHEIDREQSRFSWTTYTTSAADSPRSVAQVLRGSSPPPPVPDLPPAITIKKRPVSSSPFMHLSPYANRGSTDSTPSVVRKPLPGANPRSSSIASPSFRSMSTSKSLPLTPTVLEAADKIENFHAQLEVLERRKHNINRIIADLENSLKKNAIVYDMWKRREVEKNITNHRLELDDIGRDIHDINFVLHRAQRKRDREDGYEACTGLWIKRVTS